MSSSRNMTGFVSTWTFTLFLVHHGLLVDPLVRIVQHMRQAIRAAASNLTARRVLGPHLTLTKADGTIGFFPATVALTSTIGMPLSAPAATLKYIFGLGMTFLFPLRLSCPMPLLNQLLGCVLLETSVSSRQNP